MARFAYLATLAFALTAQSDATKRPNPQAGIQQRQTKPNVLLIMTDDQDLLLDSMSVMPNVNNLIGAQGVTYDKFYCTVAWCCPSRVNFFTGRAAHNTNVTSVTPPYGGWPKFTDNGLNNDYLPTWLTAAGVDTYYVGKFMNGFSQDNLATPEPPQGWTNSSFLVDPWTYNYYHSHWTNGVNAESLDDVTAYPGIHTTDVIRGKALDMLEEAAAAGTQFYMQVSTVAPHDQLGGDTELPPIPSQYAGVFNSRTTPQSSNFNPDVPSGASWVYNLPQLSAAEVEYGNEMYYHRLANLAYVDDVVGDLINQLDTLGILDNTYIIYTTDNGFHIGNHRLTPGKRCPYEEDVNIPLFIRGPDVASGATTSYVTSHTDMAPTILQMLGVPPQNDFDGQAIPYTSSALGSATNSDLVNVEFWNSNTTPVGLAGALYYNNTYKALRFINDDYTLLYTTWCTGEHEFYDMMTDADQMANRLANPPVGTAGTYYGRNETQLFERLDALLMVTKGCAGDSCREPWSALFPAGEVGSLEEAMDEGYDAFFSAQPKVAFSSCVQGNILAEEGPQSVVPFTSAVRRRRMRAA